MKKLYCLTRADLSKSQQAVQLGHAVAAWCLSFSAMGEWRNDTLVYLKVSGEPELRALFEEAGGIKAAFLEPDRGGELTAFAVLDFTNRYSYLRLV